MPNHVHLVARPRDDGTLGRFMHWLLTTHGQRYRARRETVGHIWQGRYKSSLIQADRHFVTVLRYIERNPVRAGIVSRSVDWEWSSTREREGSADASGLLTAAPLDLPTPWSRWVDEPLTAHELEEIRSHVTSGRPIGHSDWVDTVSLQYGMTLTRPRRGRPRKKGTVPFKIGA
jgi:putative transposase